MSAALHTTLAALSSKAWLNDWRAVRRPAFWYALLAIAMLLLLVLLIAGLIAINLWWMGAILISPFFLLVGYYALAHDTGLRDALTWLFIGLGFALSLLEKLSGYSLYFLLELLLIALVPLTLSVLRPLLREFVEMRVLFGILLAFSMISLAASYFGRSNALPALYQFLTNVKIFLLLLLGFYMPWRSRSVTALWVFIRFLWVPLLFLASWQLADIGSFAGVFRFSYSAADHPFLPVDQQANGPFNHPSILAFFSGYFFFLCVLRVSVLKDYHYLAPATGYFSVLLLSGQRQELAAFCVVVIAILFGSARNLSTRLCIGVCGVAILSGGVFLLHDNLESELHAWGVASQTSDPSPRAILYRESLSIASEYAPLGSGLGTFGGAGAEKFDRSYYLERGLGRYWWFHKEDFLMDTYWPHFLAECGWIGALLMAAAFICLLYFAAKRFIKASSADAKFLWGASLGGFGAALLISISSPILEDPFLAMLPALFIGYAYSNRVNNNP